ncbi:MAG: SDR family oxidoreductase [Anaerolineae bacterium]|nr:SDR family oxidoreductase [Anaerolineae bacterium]
MTLLPLQGRVALVTGGARRLGGAISLGLARAGADVAVHYHQSEADAEAVVTQAQALGRRAVAVRADLGQVEEARGLVAAGLDTLGRLDYLVHAASPFEAAPLAQVTEDVWDRALDTTLKGGFFVAQAAAPALAEAHGAVVFLSDIAARRPFPSFIPHSVAKAGLEALTVALARALAPHVRVNAVAPGVVLPPAHWDAARVERAAARTLVGHIGTPDDVVQTVLFLLTNDFITGQVVTVDGGVGIKD